MVDDFIKIIDAIKEYGAWPATLAIVILIIIAFVGFYVARKTQTQTIPGSQQGGASKKGLVARWLSGKKEQAADKISHPGILEPMAFKDMLLRQNMSNFMYNKGWNEGEQPSRVIMFSYHNGGHYSTGEQMSKMSLRIQVQNKNSFLGELEGDGVVRGLFRIDFPLLYEKLFQHGHFYVDNVQDLRHDDPKLYSLLSRSNINAAYIQQLTDGRGPTGFILIGFNEKPKDEKYVTNKLALFTEQLEGTLNLTLVELNQIVKDANFFSREEKEES